MEVDVLICERDGTPVAEMPGTAAIPTWRHNAPGSCTLTAAADDPLDLLLAPKREVQVWIDGACSWMGIPDTARRDTGAATVQVDCFEIPGLFGERRNKERRNYVQVDEAQIVANLVTLAQQVDDVGVDLDVVLTGTLRDRDYPADERHEFLELMIALSQVRGGPDFWLEPAADGRSRTLKVRNSRSVRMADWQLELDRDNPGESLATIASYSWSWQRPTANDVEATSGEGGAKLVERYEDAALVAAWGPIQDVISVDDGVQKSATLQARAQAEVDAGGRPIQLLGVTASGPPELIAGAFPSMVVPIVIRDGVVQVAADYRANVVTLDPYTETVQLEIEAA